MTCGLVTMGSNPSAGISRGQITLVSEPEAAFWSCRNMPYNSLYFDFYIQAKYMVLQQGGLSTFITIHDGIGQNALKRVYKTSGANAIGEEFIKFIGKILGGPVLQKIKTYHSKILIEFYSRLRFAIFKMEGESIVVRFPFVLLDAIQSITGETFNDLIKCSSYADKVELTNDMFRIDSTFALSFVWVFNQKVLKKLHEALNDPAIAHVSTLIVIGEYEDSWELLLLLDDVTRHFPHLNVISRKHAPFNVLRGAIRYGYQTHNDTSDLNPLDRKQVESESFVARLPKMQTNDFKTLIAKGDYASFENRVYLAGACNVGKSCLASILIGEEVPKKWFSTDGLTIYFGRNGIHLDDKKMIPLKKVETSIVQKLLLGNAEIKFGSEQNVYGTSVPPLSNVDGEKTELCADRTDSLENSYEDKKFTNQDQQKPIEKNKSKTKKQISKVLLKTKSDKKDLPSNIPHNIQKTAASIQRDILNEIRTGKYKVEIAPSDLVDFGGQRTYDMTHQLFIQHQGTFVLMFDGRYGLHQPLKEYPDEDITAEDILVHWVNSILLYCKEDDIMPMILFAATHSDLLTTEVNIEKQKFKQELAQLFSAHVRHRHIMYDRIFLINATNPRDQEIELLKDTLVEIAFKQTTWGQRMPLAWVPLELEISEMRTKHVSIISKKKLQDINRRNEEFTLSEYSLENFLNIQHTFGKILYFDTPGIDDFIVVQPTAMVNILRSFITDKIFWPKQKNLRRILENISSTGKVKKEHLFQLWSQPQFNELVPTSLHKEYITQVLVHLDILVEPKQSDSCRTNDVSYLVPCVVKHKLPADLLPNEHQKTICLAYHLKESIIPSSLTFKLIATPVTIWPLKETNGRHCLYVQSAIFDIDDSNQLQILIKGQRVIIYLSNKVSKHLISPDLAASIQECLTTALQRVLQFYHECFGKRLVKVDVASLFETEVGMICSNETCLVPLTFARKNQTWLCNRELTHESKYCLYWFFDKEKKTCNPECKGLDKEALTLHPTDKHLVRLAEQIGITVFDQFIIHMGLTREEWENIEYQYTQNGKLGMQLMAMYECEKKKKKVFQTLSLQDLLDALKEIDRFHCLCQIVREETNLIGIAQSMLQETPSDEILKTLPRQLGNCVIQLGIELGLSFNSIEETMYNFSKDMYSQLHDILKKWRQSSKEKPSVYTLMKALQRTDSGGLTFLREQYKNS